MQEIYERVLKKLKGQARPEAVLVVKGDPELIRILVSWPNIEISPRSYISPLSDSSSAASWGWLWKNTDYSQDDLRTNCGVDEESLKAKLAVLIGNRIIYPDGSVNPHVAKFLEQSARSLLGEGDAPGDPSAQIGPENAVGPAVANASYECFDDAWSAAKELEAKEKHADAQKAYEIALMLAENDQKKAECLHFIGWMLAQQDQHAKARDVISRTWELPDLSDRQLSSNMHLMAHLFINEGKGHLAGEWWEKIAQLDDPQPEVLCEAHVAIGYDLAAEKKYEEARRAFADCMAVDGGQGIHKGSASFHTGITYYEEKKFEDALRCFKEFLAMDDVYPEEKKKAKDWLQKTENKLA